LASPTGFEPVLPP